MELCGLIEVSHISVSHFTQLRKLFTKQQPNQKSSHIWVTTHQLRKAVLSICCFFCSDCALQSAIL